MNGIFTGVFDVWMVGLVFAVFMLLISLVYYSARRRTRTDVYIGGKRQPYMCGEEAGELILKPHTGFYRTVVSRMGFIRLRRIQSGDISDYVLAVLIGIIILLTVMVLLW